MTTSKETTTGSTGANKLKEGAVGLTYPMLDRSNYTLWALKMKVYMRAQKVWCAIENKEGTAVDEQRDQIALATIYQGLPEDILLSIANKETAKEAWNAIQTLCQGAVRVKKARIQTLKSDFELLYMKDTEQLDEFCSKLNGIVTNIRSLGEEVKEGYVVKKLLRAMPKRFLQIISTIEQFSDLETMTVDEVVSSFKAHEERMKRHTEEAGGQQLMFTEEEWNKRENSEEKLLLTREEWIKKKSRGKDNSRGGRDKSRVKCKTATSTVIMLLNVENPVEKSHRTRKQTWHRLKTMNLHCYLQNLMEQKIA